MEIEGQRGKRLSAKACSLLILIPAWISFRRLPFNPTTHIVFRIPHAELVSLKVYDLQGREVATLVDEVKVPGTYDVVWNASKIASDVYFYRLVGATFAATKKLVLIR